MCCDILNLFAGPSLAQQWQQAHPEVRGEIGSQACAVQIGQGVFGPVLRDD
ncbi:alkylmercury lyase family protein [Streptomyces sp. NBC_00158]